jgi:hypothetical protein
MFTPVLGWVYTGFGLIFVQITKSKIQKLQIQIVAITDGHLRPQYIPPPIIRVNSLQSKIYKVTNKNSSRGQLVQDSAHRLKAITTKIKLELARE